MRRLAVRAASLTAALTALCVVPPGAWGQASGTVTGQVTVTPPSSSQVCATLDSTALDFGTLSFGGSGRADLPTTVTNCSSSTELLLAHGSDATAPSGAKWLLTTNLRCNGGNPPLNEYEWLTAQANPATGTSGFSGPLSKTDQDVGTAGGAFGAGQAKTYNHALLMPCPGSSGAGETFTMSVVFTVTF